MSLNLVLESVSQTQIYPGCDIALSEGTADTINAYDVSKILKNYNTDIKDIAYVSETSYHLID